MKRILQLVSPTATQVRAKAVKFRNRIIARAAGRCEVCGHYDPTWGELLRIHHIVLVSNGGDSNVGNLIALCSNCHTAVHLFADPKFQHGGQFFRPMSFDGKVEVVMRYGYEFAAAERMVLVASQSIVMGRKGGVIHVIQPEVINVGEVHK